MQMNFKRAFKLAFVAMAVCTAFSFAEDIVATTSNGSTVILHDNGRWEYYQNNANIRDVRESAVPKDARFEVSVLYESPDKVKKNVRMALEADFATEEEIRDSLRKVPKGGYVYFQVPTKQIKPGLVRELTYSIYDTGKNAIFTKTVRDSEATASEDAGISNLLVVPIYGRPKAKVMKARVEDRKNHATLDIDIPIR
ncbi:MULTISPECIES: hypothetical protein [unclassified Fibrobacter]|jgi:hypothetical protein|uniref:hypothetical protein n=2 Tax=Fibrobacter TaxID=832 RepID=UPI0025B87C29|nr:MULTISPECIES: hypothetical protein [unclassified Fibrobacter]